MDASPINAVSHLLEGLKKTAEGRMLFGLIERGLKRQGEASDNLGEALVGFIYKVLDRYVQNPAADASTRIKVKFIQSRLTPFLPSGGAPRATAPGPKPGPSLDTPPPAVAAPVARTEPQPTPPAAEPAPDLATDPRPAAIATPATPPAPELPRTTTPAAEPVAPRPPTIEAEAVDEGVAELQDRFAAALSQTIGDDTSAPGASLASALTGGVSQDLEAVKGMLFKGLEELIHGQHKLRQELVQTASALRVAEEDRRTLDHALTQARKNSLTDELTQLPNRRALLKHLDSEVGRARRYGFSLAFALVEIDGLQQLGETYGPGAPDAVVAGYAREFAALFRGHDVAARFGAGEFALLFPNTQKDGAERALEKARKRVGGTYITFDQKTFPLPPFSSVLTLYHHGEKPEALLQRAGEALSHARQRGPQQSVFVLPAN